MVRQPQANTDNCASGVVDAKDLWDKFHSCSHFSREIMSKSRQQVTVQSSWVWTMPIVIVMMSVYSFATACEMYSTRQEISSLKSVVQLWVESRLPYQESRNDANLPANQVRESFIIMLTCCCGNIM